MLSTLAETAPSAMASSVKSASGVASRPVKAPVGLLPAPLAPVRVPAAAPTISSSAQDRNSPSPDHRAMAFLLADGE
jgi:hypothetical protein